MKNQQKAKIIVLTAGLVVVLVAAILALFLTSQNKEEEVAESPPTTTAPTSSSATTLATLEATAPETPLPADGACTQPEEADRTDPEDLMIKFLEIGYCWDSTMDPNTTTALLRGSELMTEEYANSLDPNVRNAMSADFLHVSSDNAYTVPFVDFAPDEGESTYDGNVVKEAIVTWDWHGRTGVFFEGGRSLVTISAVEDEDGIWSINGLQVNSVETKTVPANGITGTGN